MCATCRPLCNVLSVLIKFHWCSCLTGDIVSSERLILDRPPQITSIKNSRAGYQSLQPTVDSNEHIQLKQQTPYFSGNVHLNDNFLDTAQCPNGWNVFSVYSDRMQQTVSTNGISYPKLSIRWPSDIWYFWSRHNWKNSTIKIILINMELYLGFWLPGGRDASTQ